MRELGTRFYDESAEVSLNPLVNFCCHICPLIIMLFPKKDFIM